MPVNEIASSSYKSPKENWYCRSLPLRENYTTSLSKRVRKTYEKFKEKPLPPTFKTRLDGPSATWKVFSRLQMATNYADTLTKDCMVFSFEDKVGNDGQRMFLVSHPEQMWQKHRVRQLEERCSYEVIRENYPCKLYFDLEFYTCFNYEKNGNFMTEIFIKCIIASMFEQHNLLLRKSNFLWLDASNEQKFSSHLILQMNDVAFQNNLEAGTFVSILTSSLRKRIENNAPASGLWPSASAIKTLLVKSKKEKELLFCDEGVYSRNRNFRMFLSIKHGKKSPLLLSEYNEYLPFISIKCEEEEAIFYDSLVTYFRDKEITRFLRYDEEIHSDILPKPSFSRKMKINKLDVSGITSSPFPNVDNFVSRIIQDDFAIGFIRKWTYFCNEQKIIYDIGNYRFCSNIGRHHKSNNIKIVVDMKGKCYFQTCLDPDCRQEGYRSEAVAIPDGIVFVNIPDDFFDANCFSQLQCEENKVGKCDISGSFDNIYLDDMCQDWCSDFSDFTQLGKMNNSPIDKSQGNDAMHSQCQLNQVSWDAFFLENFSAEDKDNQEVNDKVYSWSLESEDSAIDLGNISLEEELLMVEAAEVTEVAINESIFSEETVF